MHILARGISSEFDKFFGNIKHFHNTGVMPSSCCVLRKAWKWASTMCASVLLCGMIIWSAIGRLMGQIINHNTLSSKSYYGLLLLFVCMFIYLVDVEDLRVILNFLSHEKAGEMFVILWFKCKTYRHCHAINKTAICCQK